MDFLDKRIQEYAEDYTSPESAALKELDDETNAGVPMPRMLSGHMQGRILAMISKIVKPKYALDIGTYTGYSAICLSEGLAEGGKLFTIDINDTLDPINKKYFVKAGASDKIEKHIGNAMDIVPKLDYKFDLVFIDADKPNYANYYDLIFDRVNTGGIIVADNVLWSGRVLDEEKDMDEDTQALNSFNKKIMNDERVENVLLPVRDGLMIIRKQ